MRHDEYLSLITGAANEGWSDDVVRLTQEALNEYPDDRKFLQILATALADKEQYYVASLLYDRVTDLYPDHKNVRNMSANALSEMSWGRPELEDKALEKFEAEIELDPESALPWIGKSFVYLQRGNYMQAGECSKQALRLKPDSMAATFNLSISMLALHMWEEGWYLYSRFRTPRFNAKKPEWKFFPDYGLPDWEGQKGRVIVIGEQGMGDEIMFASMIPDMKKDAEVVLNTSPRMENLFRRSFGCETYGLRYERECPTYADYQIPIGELGQFYRTKSEDFPGTPYLVADPLRRIQWRALFDALGRKPKVGLAWSGGLKNTGQLHRSFPLEALKPLLSYDVDWISLQYKNEAAPSFVRDFPHATRTEDYDNKAALIAELDFVVSVTTTAIHCAGALGVETHCLVPNRPSWRYGTEGNRMPWYESVQLYRQDENGEWPLDELARRFDGIRKINRTDARTPYIFTPDDMEVGVARAACAAE